ncbi:MAG: response regulator transcription factor [Caulobacteraceae bacterium]|nr:response regulator transcription factor [Caulobacteraceae bacterium]
MKILLVDDHAIVRAGLRRLLEASSDDRVFEAADGPEALARVQLGDIDLVILDLNLPGLGGVELLRRILQGARTRVLVLSMHAEPLYAARALEAGASGYVSKNAAPDELLTAVRKVLAGGRYVEAEIAQALAWRGAGPDQSMGQLTPREIEIMRLLAIGKSLSEIAEEIGVRYKTAANICSQIKTKLGVSRTADLVRLALEAGVA